MTLLTSVIVITFHGVDIRIDKEYKHVFKDETSFQESAPENVTATNIKDLIKGKDSKEVEDFVESTMNVFQDYFAEKEEKVDGQG